LKPSNLLLSDSGQIVVTDFGFAYGLPRAAEESTPATSIGGTEGFTAPELWSGQVPTPSCDVYSLGRILLYLLERLPPDERETIHARELFTLGTQCAARNPTERLSSTLAIALTLSKLKRP
jgi:serine/threonine protein kinase